jgi:hypothetical protein
MACTLNHSERSFPRSLELRQLSVAGSGNGLRARGFQVIPVSGSRAQTRQEARELARQHLSR